MKYAYFLLIICVLTLAVASIRDALCYPPAGFDYMDPTTFTMS